MKIIMLPLREWLELGQALNDKRHAGTRWFSKHQTMEIDIGPGCSIKADRKTYKAGRYYLDESK